MKVEVFLIIIERITRWLDWLFSEKRKRIKKAVRLKTEALKEKSKAKLLAACERLRKGKK